MAGLPWILLKGAFKTTAKGAAVTLTSTVASCALACYIEIGAHRAVYHFFPEKYANVEHANGLTQEQLDAVRIHRVDEPVVAIEETPALLTFLSQDAGMRTAAILQVDDRQKTPTTTSTTTTTTTTTTTQESLSRFWKEEKREERRSIADLGKIVFGSNDIMSAAMTC